MRSFLGTRVIRANSPTEDISLIQLASSLGANSVRGVAQKLGANSPVIRVRVLAGIASLAWRKGFGKMEDIRWYTTVVTLANGDGFTIGGSAPFWDDNWKDTNEDYEFFDASQNRLIAHGQSDKTLPNDGIRGQSYKIHLDVGVCR